MSASTPKRSGGWCGHYGENIDGTCIACLKAERDAARADVTTWMKVGDDLRYRMATAEAEVEAARAEVAQADEALDGTLRLLAAARAEAQTARRKVTRLREALSEVIDHESRCTCRFCVLIGEKS